MAMRFPQYPVSQPVAAGAGINNPMVQGNMGWANRANIVSGNPAGTGATPWELFGLGADDWQTAAQKTQPIWNMLNQGSGGRGMFGTLSRTGSAAMTGAGIGTAIAPGIGTVIGGIGGGLYGLFGGGAPKMTLKDISTGDVDRPDRIYAEREGGYNEEREYLRRAMFTRMYEEMGEEMPPELLDIWARQDEQRESRSGAGDAFKDALRDYYRSTGQEIPDQFTLQASPRTFDNQRQQAAYDLYHSGILPNAPEVSGDGNLKFNGQSMADMIATQKLIDEMMRDQWAMGY